jgi:probable HAF family extracellular repeat protein
VRQGFAISADGTIVVGRSNGARGSEAFLWEALLREN